MAAAANFAFANRQVLTHSVRECLRAQFGEAPASLVYDLAHNIAKFEDHTVQGRILRLCVHRKGATRALPARDPRLPADLRAVGQPALVPGDMGRTSYVMLGAEGSLREAFGSCCHGAGRVMSRTQAKKESRGRAVVEDLRARGIAVRSASRATLVEEISEAYKDVANVVEVVQGAGLARKVVQLRPIIVVKG